MATLGQSLTNLFAPNRGGVQTDRIPEQGALEPGAVDRMTPWQRAEHFTEWQQPAWGGAEEAYQRMANRAMQGATAEGFRLQGMAEGSMAEMKDLVRGALPGIMESPLDAGMIGDQYAGMLEDIARMKAADMEAVTQYTGAAGLRGGVAADLVAQVELGALGAVSRGMRDLRALQTEVEARHKVTQLNAVLGGGQILGAPPPTLGYEGLANLAEWYGAGWGAERAERVQKDVAGEQKKAALISGAFGLAGGIARGAFA